MSGGFLMTVVAIAAIWPFGRNKDAEEPGTIADLDGVVVEVAPGAPIASSDAKAIESYRAFLDLASSDPLLQAEAMRRLADLQLESDDALEVLGDSEALDGVVGGTISLYEELLESYPDYEKSDLVLYQLSRAYEAAGDNDAALSILDRLVDEYPETIHLAEAEFRRGETLFVAERYDEAEDAYSAVLAEGDRKSVV